VQLFLLMKSMQLALEINTGKPSNSVQQ